MVDRIYRIRPAAVAYLWGIAGAFIATGSSNIHPVFAGWWDGVATLAAVACIALPFIHGPRLRSGLVTITAFTAIAHAIEWVRLTEGSSAGISAAILWVVALTGVVGIVVADQEVE